MVNQTIQAQMEDGSFIIGTSRSQKSAKKRL